MKIEQNKNLDISIGISQSETFKLEQDNGILYDILRSKMYRDPISSIVREIASNSRDANRDAGNRDEAIEVYFKDTDNLLFALDSKTINFKDNGKGINPELISDIYLTYGASTKRDSNDQTGGFGLGCKTPFAHTDQFAVTTVCDYNGKRIKYSYLASIDSSNKGKFSLVEDEETTEDTGTLITIPLKKDSEEDFKRACNHYFQYWDVPIEGFERAEIIYKDDVCNAYDSKEFNVFLLIDGIYYPLMKNDKIKSKEAFERLGLKINIGLIFNTGDLEIQPSREDIRYTDENIEKINEKLNSLSLDSLKEKYSVT